MEKEIWDFDGAMAAFLEAQEAAREAQAASADARQKMIAARAKATQARLDLNACVHTLRAAAYQDGRIGETLDLGIADSLEDEPF